MIRLHLLGSVELKSSGGDEIRSIIAQPKPMAMLAYLAAATPAGYRRREELLSVFWPELDATRGRRALSQALHVLRSELPEDAIETRGVEEIGLDSAVISSDVDDFRHAIDSADYKKALDLYRGELLSGFLIHGSPEFDQWLDKERSRLKAQAIDAARRLVSEAAGSGDYASAQRWAKRALELDPYSEEGLRDLLAILDKSGNRSEAVRTYEEFRARLERDLEVQPSSETQGLLESMRAASTSQRPTVRERESHKPDLRSGPRTQSTVAAPQSRRGAWLKIAIPIIAIGVISAALVIKGKAASDTATTSTAGNRIVIAEFESAPGDSTLGRTVTEALRLDLSRSHLIDVMSDATTRDALALMRRDTMLRITPDVAREVAIRENAKAILAGDVRRAGAGFALSVRLVSARDGDLISGWRAAAQDSTELLKAIDQLSSSVRRDAGESMKAITASSPLLHVSTASLSALRKHAMGLDAFYAEDYRRAVMLFREAVAEDSTFADAYLMLSTILQNSWTHPSEGVEAAVKAYRFRDKLRDAERYNVVANYMWAVKGDIEAAVDAHSNVAQLDPDIVFWGRYAQLLMQLGRHREAELAMLRGLQWETNPFMYVYLASSRFRQGKTEEAKRTVAYGARKYPDNSVFVSQRIEMAEATSNYRIADSLAHSAQSGPNGFPKVHAAFMDLISGKVNEARGHLMEVRRGQETSRAFSAEIATAILIARLELDAAHDTVRALSVADDIVKGAAWANLYPRERPYGLVAHLYTIAGKADRAREMLSQYDRNVPDDYRAKERQLVQRVRVMLAAAAGDRRAPEDIADAVSTSQFPLDALADLVWSFNRLGMRDQSARAARQYLSELMPRRLDGDAFNLSTMRQLAGKGDSARYSASH